MKQGFRAAHISLWLLTGCLVASGCTSGTKLAVQQTQLTDQIEDMHKRAYRCSPKELALAESHNEFARWELKQGNYRRAKDHLTHAMPLAELADQQSRAAECQDVMIAMNLDTDGDGIFDEVDACPNDPENFNNVDDEDGCPEIDTDEDGYYDPVDGCPTEPEDFDGDRDEDGCPDIEFDKDGDGILDNDDRCPLDPEDPDGFEDDDGCPEPDNDNDKICDPWVDERGEQDKYPDCSGNDQCINDPEDIDQFEDEDGCPDLDNDNDKILDTDDKCPLEPEDYDGDTDSDGCPEERTLVVIKEDRIELTEKVYFDTNKTTIQSRSYPLLDEIGTVLVENPSIHIRIEGHTDSKGSAKYNMKLSNGRAESVMKELIARGITEDRMISVGFGEDRPIDTNETPEGRQNNRRVELHITKR